MQRDSIKLMQTDTLQNWVEEQMIRGFYIFTQKDVEALNIFKTKKVLKNAIYRLIKKGLVISPWQNFYVTVPTEYRLRGEVPPSFYIDRLMTFLGRKYYVSLLSAAELNGAGHQKAMVFQVIVNGKSLRSGIKNGTRIEFTTKKDIPFEYINKVKTQNGYMNVSSAELTALDIVANEEKIGGLSRTAEVLVELADNLHWENDELSLLNHFKTPVIQRLGYLLDIIEENNLADNLMALAQQSGKQFRRIPLKSSKPINKKMDLDQKWKVIINQDIEIDNI